MKKLTLQDCKDLARDKDGRCLSDFYKNSRTKLQWECSKGHLWEATHSSVSQGSWCPYCAGNAVTLEDCKVLAHSRGGYCLSDRYINNLEKMEWMCNCGHKWKAPRVKIQSGCWCYECFKSNRAIGLDACISLAENKGGHCLEICYINNKTLMAWRCKKGHVFKHNLQNIKNGSWCPHCERNFNLIDLDICKDFAKNKGGKCLSKKYLGTKTGLKWKCKKGHAWIAPPYRIIVRGQWCKVCAGMAKKNIDHCLALAKKNKGKCLSQKYERAHAKIRWQCKEGHIFEQSFTKVKSGRWCPLCGGNAEQKKLFKIIKKLFPGKKIYYNYKGFGWLQGVNGGQQEIDIYVDGILGVEYDGEQHFKSIDFFGGDERLKYTKLLDKNKNKLIKAHKDVVPFFIRFNYKEQLNEEYVKTKLIKLGVLNE